LSPVIIPSSPELIPIFPEAIPSPQTMQCLHPQRPSLPTAPVNITLSPHKAQRTSPLDPANRILPHDQSDRPLPPIRLLRPRLPIQQHNLEF
jgi:hypothetical protein